MCGLLAVMVEEVISKPWSSDTWFFPLSSSLSRLFQPHFGSLEKSFMLNFSSVLSLAPFQSTQASSLFLSACLYGIHVTPHHLPCNHVQSLPLSVRPAWIAVVVWYSGCRFVMKACVGVYLWCRISKGKTKITLGYLIALNEAIITLLYLQKGTTPGVIALRFLCRCCMCSPTHRKGQRMNCMHLVVSNTVHGVMYFHGKQHFTFPLWIFFSSTE